MKEFEYILKLNKNAGIKNCYHNLPQNRLEQQRNIKKSSSSMTQKNIVSDSPYEKAKYLADSATNLDDLRNSVQKYDGLIIKKTAMKTVFSDGNPNAGIMLIGEAPGANEDKYGIPFCGQSGKLLDNILLSIGLDRTKVYISNTVFWRPPGNRRPTPEEIKLCKPFVEKHIALINPKLIILVGGTAVESLLNIKSPITMLRKSYFEYGNKYLENHIKTSIIFHPSYLLRQPLQKKLMWFDILKIKKDLM